MCRLERLYHIILLMCIICFPVLADTTSDNNSQTPMILSAADLLQSSRRWQLSIQPSYGSETTQSPQVFGVNVTARQTFAILPVDIAFKASACSSFSLHIPYLQRKQEYGVADETTHTTDSGLGDIVVGIERDFTSKRMSGWNGLFGLNVSLPTGKNVYDNLTEDELPIGIGHYQTGMSLSYRRLADPVVVSGGFNVNYIWPRQRGSEEVRPGVGFTIKTGIGYALSDRWVVTEELEFIREPNIFLQNAFTAITETVDQAYLTHSFIYNRSRNSPSYVARFSIGLNDQSTDFMAMLGVQH